METKTNPIVWMFSGQGSQYYQMGKGLYNNNDTFRFWMDRLDQLAVNYVGHSIVEMLYDKNQSKSESFDQILYTHPALFMVQYSLAKTLLAENLPSPDYLFGASLGEFVAAAFADVADVEKMLFDIIKQARLFDMHCGGGAMLVVIDDIDSFKTNPLFSDGCELAGVNFDRSFVVSGLQNKILQLAEQLKKQDITHQILPVSVAFHSSHIDVVKDIFMKTFANNIYHPAKIPIISCLQSADVEQGRGVAVMEGHGGFSSTHWWTVIRQPIAFKQTLVKFQHNHPQAVYLDVSPSGNMATFTKYNLPESMHNRIMSIMTPFGNEQESIDAVKERLIR
ncbi:MAG: acyltransferase domain-containing protein [Methylococcales bacterium]|nr:acyltransferase domain-containing protein [Methylococcales bacterium]